jgi:hypothetical protein
MMQHITGIARNQMVFTSLVDSISEDNPVLCGKVAQVFSGKMIIETTKSN